MFTYAGLLPLIEMTGGVSASSALQHYLGSWPVGGQPKTGARQPSLPRS
jgi:hypothetical protein